MEKRAMKLLADPFEELAYHEGAVLRGINFKWKTDSVLMVVKVTKRLDGDLVAFIEGKEFSDCWEMLAASIYTTKFKLTWRKDKYA